MAIYYKTKTNELFSIFPKHDGLIYSSKYKTNNRQGFFYHFQTNWAYLFMICLIICVFNHKTQHLQPTGYPFS